MIVDGALSQAEWDLARECTTIASVMARGWSRTLSVSSIIKRRQGTGSSCVLWHSLFLHAGEVVLDSLVLLEVLAEPIFVQVRFQAENLLGYFLVFALDSLQLGLPLVKVQALCFELEIGNGLALA